MTGLETDDPADDERRRRRARRLLEQAARRREAGHRARRGRAALEGRARRRRPDRTQGRSERASIPKNNGFWRDLLARRAIQVSAADEAPSKWDIYVESFKDAVKNLPENIAAGASHVASSVASVAGDVAHGVGKVANEAGKGLFSGFGTPLLIGGGLARAVPHLAIAQRDQGEE